MLSIGSLFSGIGGLELGLEWAGLGPVRWQVEQSEFCRSILAKHWPDVERFDDVCKVGSTELAPVDLICGGFPCQDISSAGKGAGLAGRRSGLWFEFARVVSELCPAWVVAENVTSGAKRWVDAVVAGLEQLDYETTPFTLSAGDVGAPHRRARVFIVAYAVGEQLRQQPGRCSGSGRSCSGIARDNGAQRQIADADRIGRPGRLGTRERNAGLRELADCRSDATDAVRGGLQGAGPETQTRGIGSPADTWSINTMPEPSLCRVDDGAREWLHRNDRIKALGNSVVPQCAEVIGWIIRELAGI